MPSIIAGCPIEMIQGFNCLKDDRPSQGVVGQCLYGSADYGDDETSVMNALAWYAAEEVLRAYDDIPLGDGSYEISPSVVHGQNVYVPLDDSGAIAAIHREWGELESETRQAIARRKQAYSYLAI